MTRVFLSALIGACALHGSAAAQVVPPRHLIAVVRPGAAVALLDRPFGRAVGVIGPRTEFGSPRALAVITSRQGRWLGVTEPGVGHNRLVWVDAERGGVRYAQTAVDLVADLSSRRLIVRRNGVAIRMFPVGIGRPGSPTPTGRFGVTDKLDGSRFGSVYGCCILALSATQPKLPVGWRGGDRMAIHGSASESDLGRAVSAGCLHASERDLRYLMRAVRLGTPVLIRR